jgi:integrase/recombinase XerD
MSLTQNPWSKAQFSNELKIMPVRDEGWLMRTLAVCMPSGDRYWTVVDTEFRVVLVADEYLRHVRFGRDGAESTTRTYAGAVRLYLLWCRHTGQEWRTAAGRLGSFILWLRHVPSGDDVAVPVLSGPGAEAVRSPGRINVVLTGVRGFLAFAVDQGEASGHVLHQIYELADSRHLPVAARGEEGVGRLRLRARHRVHEPKDRVDRASDEEAVALFRACRSARDRFLVLLLARAGLRRSEAVGLRREDVHFMVESTHLGCDFPGSHLHVVRRDNINGAWAKSRHSRIVPVDRLVVQAHDLYVLERHQVPDAMVSDLVLVNLFRPPVRLARR